MLRFLLFVVCLLAAGPLCALQPVPVAESVYAFIGERGEISPANQGHVANSGFIVGSSGVIVVDTGVSYRHGKQMISAIRSVTQQPIVLVLITHALQEFVFGSAAFAELGVPLLTHAKTAELMRQRCNHCLENLISQLGAQVMEGTRLVVPEQTVERSQSMRVGGRDIELLYLGWASTPGDLVVLDRASGVAFAGGLITNRRIPELRDGHLGGWLAALEALERTAVRAIVPGHGPVGGHDLADVTAAYLRALDGQVQTLYKSGATLTQTVDNVALPAYNDWNLYPALHRQNALHRFLQLETEELSR
jgi:glyoxylase-like metal-dependent hydrolase (beta-lactamase superfamily II)